VYIITDAEMTAFVQMMDLAERARQANKVG